MGDVSMRNNKVSILGCGWSGLPLAANLAKDGYTVKGSVTSPGRMATLAMKGVIPFRVVTGMELEADRLDDFLRADALVVTLPPPRMEGIPDYHLKAHSAIVKAIRSSDIQTVVLYSSTSVYPELNTVVVETDAQRIISSHSGVAMIDIERIYNGLTDRRVVVLRFGGLIGPDRHPGRFMQHKTLITQSEAPVNVVHLDDVVAATRFVIAHEKASGEFNVCAPETSIRRQFYTKAISALGSSIPAFDEKAEPWKKVSSNRIQAAGYHFIHHDPCDWL